MADFSSETIDAVWRKAQPQENNNPDIFRRDYAGAWIKRSDYGNHTSKYGWEIDHLKPVSQNGTDELDNLIPLHWRNNRSKGDDYPDWKTVYSSKGVENEEFVKYWHV